MDKFKKITEIICFSIIFAFFFLASQQVLNEIIFHDESNRVIPITNAFLGAFFAFLFIRIGDFLNAIYARKKQHHTALVRLEYFLNECFNQIIDNISVIDGFISFINKTKDTNIIPIYANTFQPFDINKEILVDLANIDLINEIACFFVDLNRANSDMLIFSRIYDELREGLIQKTISRVEFKYNISNLVLKLAELKKYFLSLEQKTEKNCSIVRLLLKDKMIWSQIVSKLFKDKLPENSKIIDEISKLHEERQQNIAKSKQKIDQILQK